MKMELFTRAISEVRMRDCALAQARISFHCSHMESIEIDKGPNQT